MDKIQKELCRLGRKDLAQLYYLKVAGFADIVEEPKKICFATRYDQSLFIHFKIQPGIKDGSFAYLKETVENFYSLVLPRLIRIKEIAEKIGVSIVEVPIIDFVFICALELSCTMTITAENNLLIDQLISILKLEIKEN
jgi:hypothetical protein